MSDHLSGNRLQENVVASDLCSAVIIQHCDLFKRSLVIGDLFSSFLPRHCYWRAFLCKSSTRMTTRSGGTVDTEIKVP